MQKLAKTQASVLLAYSSPFVLLVALALNIWMNSSGLSQGPVRLLILSASFPVGLSLGRLLYRKRSHVEIVFDEKVFSVAKGGKEVASGNWRSYRTVSIKLDHYGRPNLRLYKSTEEFVELPIFRTGVLPQEFRDFVQKLMSGREASLPSLQVVEAS